MYQEKSIIAVKNKLESINNIKTRIFKFKKIRLNKQSIKYKEIAIMCKKMSILFESGCEITKILTILEEQSTKKVARVISKIHNHIQNGNSIATSFQFTKLFPQFFISMVKAGEISGNLEKVMDDLSNYYNKEYTLRSKIINALIYPTILMSLCFISVLFMLLFVIPNFQMVFETNNVNPPIITKIVIDISILVRNYFIYIIVGIIFLILFIFYYAKSNNGLKHLVIIMNLKLPLLRRITSLVITSKFSRALEIMLKSGIQIIDAVDISARTIDNNFIYKKIEISKENIEKGNSIGSSLVLANIFPSLFISMINIGEESGKLDSSLTTINRFYENELDNAMDKIIKLIEPIIIVFMGIVVGACIIAMVIPMFNVVSAIQ